MYSVEKYFKGPRTSSYSSLCSILYMYMCECTERLLFPVSSQVRCTAADTSQPAGSRSGKRERGEGAGRGNQRAVLRRQVLRQNPPRPTSQVYEIKLDFHHSFDNSRGWCSQPVVPCTIHAFVSSFIYSLHLGSLECPRLIYCSSFVLINLKFYSFRLLMKIIF